MKKLFFLCCVVLTGCKTFPAHTQNSCLFDAASYQYAAQLDEKKPTAMWGRLLLVEQGGLRHYFYIFQSMEGNFYYQDWRGSQRLWRIKTLAEANDAKTVAKQINPLINWGEYETKPN